MPDEPTTPGQLPGEPEPLIPLDATVEELGAILHDAVNKMLDGSMAPEVSNAIANEANRRLAEFRAVARRAADLMFEDVLQMWIDRLNHRARNGVLTQDWMRMSFPGALANTMRDLMDAADQGAEYEGKRHYWSEFSAEAQGQVDQWLASQDNVT